MVGEAHMYFKGIKGRWMVNGIAVVVLVVAVSIIAFSYFNAKYISV